MKTKYTKEVLQSTTTAATYDHKEMILITRTPYRNYAATKGPAGTEAYERERHHRHLHRREPRKHMKDRTDNGRDGCWILLQRLAAAASPIAADSTTTGHMDINDGGDNPVSAKKKYDFTLLLIMLTGLRAADAPEQCLRARAESQRVDARMAKKNKQD